MITHVLILRMCVNCVSGGISTHCAATNLYQIYKTFQGQM